MGIYYIHPLTAFCLFSRTDECPYFEGTFVAKDTEVAGFVKRVRDKVKSVSFTVMYVITFSLCAEVSDGL